MRTCTSPAATDIAQIDIPSFLEQAKEYEEVEDIRDSVIKLLAVEGQATRSRSCVPHSCSAGPRPRSTGPS